MKINLVLFLASNHEAGKMETLMKTFESDFRPVKGDILDDPGFDPDYHNGYEVVKVTIDYSQDLCWVSLTPLAIDLVHLSFDTYIKKLRTNGWNTLTL
ncbi:hypothetical protein D3H55_04880 [Bacillus salacetis]|uniref:Uncharacterized protein n=2 Tax=Bacillus salacetis TaxID=2315464 RepID=A0A3A1R7X5_9BACI|nr:hypothetical protein D3H55_04880 [Bacillus salacetis]